MRHPFVVVVAGPNGSGKSELVERIRLRSWAENTTFLNADYIAEHELGDWNDPRARRRSALITGRRREDLIQKRTSFMCETVLTRLEFIERAKEQGFQSWMFYIATSSPAINMERIRVRHQQGGHFVPEDEVHKRYYRSIQNCAEACMLVDRAFVFDNSVFDAFPTFLFRTTHGKVRRVYQQAFPAWANRVIQDLEVGEGALS
ncbi:MAG: zeta toxin family protein [Pseudomonadaceae bacterium]|nr:zeta toxin family protein [Pseudomonadaceae bacterium]